MAEPSQVPAKKSAVRLRKCVDCGAEFESKPGFATSSTCCEACERRRLDLIDATLSTSGPAIEMVEPPKSSRLWLLWVALALVGFLGAGWFIMGPKIMRYWDKRQAQELVARSKSFFEKGDIKKAILDSRSALDLDPKNVEANRIIARGLESLGSPDAILWRKRLNSFQPDDAENNLALAKGAFDAGDFPVAQEAILKLAPTHENSTLYHEIAAGLAASRHDMADAESHWAAAARLDPGNDDYKLKRATLQIKSSSPETHAEAVKALEELARIDSRRIVALRLLIDDAMNRRRSVRAKELVDTLVTCAEATFLDKVWRLSVLRTLNDARATRYLLELKEEALAKPKELSQLMNWMNQSNLALLVGEWAAELPREMLAAPPVANAVADAYVQSTDWRKLKDLTAAASWGNMDFLRRAYLSRAYHRLGDSSPAEGEWGKALAEAEGNPLRLQSLVKLTQGWRWEQGSDQALRKLSADETSPVWVINSLWEVSLKAGDSTELYRLAKLLVRADAGSISAQDKLNRLSLIRHSDEGNPHVRAEELYRQNPTDVSIATTYALSLYMQAKIFDCLAVMRPFKLDQLREPRVALYHGMFLARAGRTREAIEYLQLGETVPLLREEQDLLEKVKRECRIRPMSATTEVPAAATGENPPPAPR